MRRLIPALLLLAACAPSGAPMGTLAAAREAGHCGRVEEAAEILGPLVDAYGNDPEVVLLAGDVATWRDRPEDGLRHYRRAAELAPGDPRPHLHAAYVLVVYLGMDAENVAAAREEADAAHAAAGGIESATYRACRGEIAWVSGAEEEAETWFRAALELDPQCRWSLQRLVQILPPDRTEHAALRARLDAKLANERGGEGMSRGRGPVTFCGN